MSLIRRLATALAILVLVTLAACSSASTTPSPTAAPAAKLVFTAQPARATSGQPFDIQPVVVAQDARGETATGFRGVVTLTITATGSSQPRIFGGTTAIAVNGIARFNSLLIDKAGTGYTLTAASPNLPAATSAPFNVAPGPAAQLVFTRGGVTTPAGAVFSVQPVVEVQDAEGNIVPDYAASIQVGLRYGRAPLLGNTIVKPVNGVATYSGLYMNAAGDSLALAAVSGSLIIGFSDEFNVTPGPAVKLAFTTQPTFALAGGDFETGPVVEVQDIFGNQIPTSTANVTVAITPGTGSPGAVLSGPTRVNADKGQAYIGSIIIDKAGAGYTLTATSPNLAPATSAPFPVIALPK